MPPHETEGMGTGDMHRNKASMSIYDILGQCHGLLTTFSRRPQGVGVINVKLVHVTVLAPLGVQIVHIAFMA